MSGTYDPGGPLSPCTCDMEDGRVSSWHRPSCPLNSDRWSPEELAICTCIPEGSGEDMACPKWRGGEHR